MEQKQLRIEKRLVVIGGGVIGIAIAREASFCNPFSNIIAVEKESILGMHPLEIAELFMLGFIMNLTQIEANSAPRPINFFENIVQITQSH